MQPHDFANRFFLGQDRTQGAPPAELCAPEYRLELTGFPTMDHAGHDQFARGFYSAFPDLYHMIDEAVTTTDGLAVRFTLRGTQRGAFLGIPATGATVTIEAIGLMTLRDGRVTRLRGQFDRLGLLQQLGAVPA